MKGILFNGLKIAIDYSGNFTRGVAIDQETGKVFEGNVSDIEFDEANEKSIAEGIRNAKTTDTGVAA